MTRGSRSASCSLISLVPLPPAKLFLRQHVFLCPDARHWVILDVVRDDYICVEREQFESLGPWLHGWETSKNDPRRDDVSQMPGDAAALAAELLDAGILSQHPEDTKDARATLLAPSTTELAIPTLAPARRCRWYHIPAFFLSSIAASLLLRVCPWRSTVSYVSARRRRNLPSTEQVFDIDRARTLVEAFETLRPWYPRPYLCTFDSLALLNFMAWHRLFPAWVFGVTADPFKAHCWVRAGSTILNDTLERTAAFTPIMQV